MATLYKSGLVESNSAFTPFPQGTVGMRTVTHNLSAAVVATDVIQLIPLKKGERLLAFQLSIPDVDGGSAFQFDLGYGNSGTNAGTNVAALASNSTVGRSAGVVTGSVFSVDEDAAFEGGPVTITADTTLDMRIDATAATPAAGDIVATVWIA